MKFLFREFKVLRPGGILEYSRILEHQEISLKSKGAGILKISTVIWNLLDRWNFKLPIKKYGICQCQETRCHIGVQKTRT